MTAPRLVDTSPVGYPSANVDDPVGMVWRPCRTWQTASGLISVVTEIGDDGPSVTNAAEAIYEIVQKVHPGSRVIEHYPAHHGGGETYDEIRIDPGGSPVWRSISPAELTTLVGAELDTTRPTEPAIRGTWK